MRIVRLERCDVTVSIHLEFDVIGPTTRGDLEEVLNYLIERIVPEEEQ